MITDRDKAQLESLRQLGVNVEVAQAVRFFLYFPVEPSAKGAAMRLREQGFKTDIVDSGDGVPLRWMLTAYKTMVPSEINISRTNELMARTAKTMSGSYDNWSLGG